MSGGGFVIRDGGGALAVNRFEIEITSQGGRTTYPNGFTTDLAVAADNLAELAACGRARRKIGNRAFNLRKTKDHHRERDFGQGSRNLAALPAAMICRRSPFIPSAAWSGKPGKTPARHRAPALASSRTRAP